MKQWGSCRFFHGFTTQLTIRLTLYEDLVWFSIPFEIHMELDTLTLEGLIASDRGTGLGCSPMVLRCAQLRCLALNDILGGSTRVLVSQNGRLWK